MSKAPANFRQTDITRALRAARAAGLKVSSVDVDAKTGDFVLRIKDDPEHHCDDGKEATAAVASG